MARSNGGWKWTAKLGSTILPEILPAVVFFTLISVIVVVVFDRLETKLQVNTIMLSVLGLIISFAISLRTSTANDRFNEGRKAWAAVTQASRNFALNVWIHSPPTTLTAAELAEIPADSLEMDLELAKGLIEKRTILNLIKAFSVATKHYVREEQGIYYEDLYHLIQSLPKYNFPSSVANYTSSDPESLLEVLGLWRLPMNDGSGRHYVPASVTPTTLRSRNPTRENSTLNPEKELSVNDICMPEAPRVCSPEQIECHKIHLLPANNPPKPTIYDHFPILSMFKPVFRFFGKRFHYETRRDKQKRRVKEEKGSNIPLQITMFLTGYLTNLFSRGTLPVSLVTTYVAPLMMLQDSMATLERVLTTPLPFAYQAHLRFSIYIYLLFLPFQTYYLLHYLSIVATAIASTIFLGFIELGAQLEDPFGYDDSDLPLDHYCTLISQEIEEIARHAPPNPASYVFSSSNQPFGDSRTAADILESIRCRASERETNPLWYRRAFHEEMCKNDVGSMPLSPGFTKRGKNRQMPSVDVVVI